MNEHTVYREIMLRRYIIVPAAIHVVHRLADQLSTGFVHTFFFQRVLKAIHINYLLTDK